MEPTGTPLEPGASILARAPGSGEPLTVRRITVATLVRTLLFGVCIVIALADSAQAYVRTRAPGSARVARWRSPELTLWVDTSHLPPGVSAEQFMATARQSAAAWSAPAVGCTAVRLRVQQSTTSLTGGTRDGRNSIVFQTQRWCRGGSDRSGNCYDARATSYTTAHFGTAGPNEREVPIEEADIELNAVGFEWDNGRTRSADLRWVLTHELGHVLGFEHTCTARRSLRALHDEADQPVPACTRSLLSAIMAPAPDPSALARSRAGALDDDAVSGVCGVYPGAQGTPNAGPASRWLVALVALAALSGLMAVLTAVHVRRSRAEQRMATERRTPS